MANDINHGESASDILSAMQQEFVSQFLAADSPLHHQLIAPPGYGKTHTTALLIGSFVQELKVAKILYLTPAITLQEQARSQLSRGAAAQTTHKLDRLQFREFLADVGPGEVPWPDSCVLIATIAFARQPDIAEAIASTNWDLVVVDEAHQLVGQVHDMIKRVVSAGNAKRLLLVTMSPLDDPPIDEGLETTDWRPRIADLRDQQSTRLERKSIPIAYSTIERECFKWVDALSKEVEGNEWVSLMILKRCDSSLYVLEQTIRRMRNDLAHGAQSRGLTESDEEESMGSVDVSPTTWNWRDPSKALELASKILEIIGQMQIDSKLETVQELLAKITANDSSASICIYTIFADTADYLVSTLDLDFEVFEITGATPFNERQLLLDRFRQGSCVLVATDAVSTGTDLATGSHLIHYETLLSDTSKQKRLGRFDRLGRTNPLEEIEFERLSE